MADEKPSTETATRLTPQSEAELLTGEDAPPQPGRVLVVDDQRTTLTKLSRAVQYLGHDVTAVDNAGDALIKLQETEFDAVLLDMLMPEMDGLEFLRQKKSIPQIAPVPVVVISGLDDRTVIAEAITLGAEDYLPKNFDPILLTVRLNGCLLKSRIRAIEKNDRHRIEQLSAVAAVLETGQYNPQQLGIEALIDHPDHIGKLSRVFTQLASQLYHRERRQRQQIKTLNAVLLMLIVGFIFGLGVPLTRMISVAEAHPTGLAFWVEVATFVMASIILVFRRSPFPRELLSRESVRFFSLWGLLGAVSQYVLFWVAPHLSAAIISIILVTEGLLVFGLSALMHIERLSLRRGIGLSIGFIGVLLIFSSGIFSEGVHHWIWVFIALTLPLLYALEDMLVSNGPPAGCDLLTTICIGAIVSAFFLLPPLILLGDFMTPLALPEKSLIILLLLSIISLVGNILLVRLLVSNCAVFGSQLGYVLTFCGVIWSMLLLNESLSWLGWAAFGVTVIGVILVEPQEEPESTPTFQLTNSIQDS